MRCYISRLHWKTSLLNLQYGWLFIVLHCYSQTLHLFLLCFETIKIQFSQYWILFQRFTQHSAFLISNIVGWLMHKYRLKRLNSYLFLQSSLQRKTFFNDLFLFRVSAIILHPSMPNELPVRRLSKKNCVQFLSFPGGCLLSPPNNSEVRDSFVTTASLIILISLTPMLHSNHDNHDNHDTHFLLFAFAMTLHNQLVQWPVSSQCFT